MRSERLSGWLQSLRVYAEPPVARMLLLGFAAGLPLLLVLGTLSYRLREAGIDRTTIGFRAGSGSRTASSGRGHRSSTSCRSRS